MLLSHIFTQKTFFPGFVRHFPLPPSFVRMRWVQKKPQSKIPASSLSNPKKFVKNKSYRGLLLFRRKSIWARLQECRKSMWSHDAFEFMFLRKIPCKVALITCITGKLSLIIGNVGRTHWWDGHPRKWLFFIKFRENHTKKRHF